MSASTKAVLSQLDRLDDVVSKLESQVARNPSLPPAYSSAVKNGFAAIASLRAALAEGEAESADCKAAFEAWCIETANSPEPTSYTYPQDLDVEAMFLAFKAGRYSHPSPAALRAAVIEALDKVIGLCDEKHDKHLIAAIRSMKEADSADQA